MKNCLVCGQYEGGREGEGERGAEGGEGKEEMHLLSSYINVPLLS